MRLLLDTHTVLRFFMGNSRLSDKVRDLVEDGHNHKAFDAFRDRLVAEGINLEVDDIFANVRDDTPTPEKPGW